MRFIDVYVLANTQCNSVEYLPVCLNTAIGLNVLAVAARSMIIAPLVFMSYANYKEF